MLELQNIGMAFGKHWVLRDICLEIQSGQRVALMGASGVGKTTLLRIIAGLEAASEGQLIWKIGQNATKLRSKPIISYLTQDYALYPQLTVRKNLQAALSPLKLSRQERDERIAEYLNSYGLTELADRIPSSLSGGQTQRAAIAKAMVRHPDLLLLDEPLSQLDTLRKEEVRQLLLEGAARSNTTMIVVLHDASDAFQIATQVAVLEQGECLQYGSPREVFGNPATQLVGTLTSQFPINWLRPSQWLPLLKSGSCTFAQDSSLLTGHESDILGIRSDQISLCEPSPDASNTTNSAADSGSHAIGSKKIQADKFVFPAVLKSMQWCGSFRLLDFEVDCLGQDSDLEIRVVLQENQIPYDLEKQTLVDVSFEPSKLIWLPLAD